MFFGSMDKLIPYFNAKYPNITLMYSTPSDYIQAVHSLNITWPTKYDDMFPYADDQFSYWTGYFTSRANSKEYIRRASYNMHAANKLYSVKALEDNIDENLLINIMVNKENMMDQMGINQHHDAVTGTGKQAVADDYNLRLFNGMESNNNIYSIVLDEIF
jgi:hypothetical protein